MEVLCVASKKCGKCKKVKPLAEFSKNKRQKDGLQYECKPCASERGATAQAKNRAKEHVVHAPGATKHCPDCLETKAVTAFSADRTACDHLQGHCKPCDAKRGAERQATNRAKEHVIHDPNATKRCPDCGETKPVAAFPSDRTTCNHLNNYCKKCSNRRTSAHKKANPLQGKAHSHKRRARKRDAPGGSFTSTEYVTLLQIVGCLCGYCTADIANGGDHADHVNPLCRGGAGDIANILPACPACNLSKGPKTITEWRGKGFVSPLPCVAFTHHLDGSTTYKIVKVVPVQLAPIVKAIPKQLGLFDLAA